MAMKYLILTHDLDAAIAWITGQLDCVVMDERELALQNPTKFRKGFLDIAYSEKMVEYARIISLTYKASRPLAIVMDMRHQTAVGQIHHDTSILYYDGRKKNRLAYHPRYTVDVNVNNSLQNLSEFS